MTHLQPIKMDYYSLTHSLLDSLQLVYNKLYGNGCLNYIEKVDKFIMRRIIEVVVKDISELAAKVMED